MDSKMSLLTRQMTLARCKSARRENPLSPGRRRAGRGDLRLLCDRARRRHDAVKTSGLHLWLVREAGVGGKRCVTTVGWLATAPITSALSKDALTRRIVVALLPVAAIALAFLPLTPAYDVDVFLRAGDAAAHGLQVYPTAGTPAVYSGFSFVYPYFALWPFMLVADLPAARAHSTAARFTATKKRARN